MNRKLNKDNLPFLILGACNPVYADKVLCIGPHMSVMLPFDVVLRIVIKKMIEIVDTD